MTKMIRVIIAVLVTNLLCSSSAFAEYNSSRLAEAIGGFLIVNDMLEKLSNSKCGYAVKKNYSFNAALNETMPYLNDGDRRELSSFLQSKKFKNDLSQNDEFISGVMRAGLKDGLDEKTICGMMVSNISTAFQKSKLQWEYAKEFYSK